MYLTHCQTVGLSPFGDMEFPFVTPQGEPRMLTVVSGRGGVGKTSLLQVLASTRPGYAAVLLGRGTPAAAPPHAVCEWVLGADDADRPHPLVVVTPNAKHPGDDESSSLRRREQAHYERAAKERGGFVFCVLPAARWFSRQPVAIHAPLRSVAQYDVRAVPHFDDATHCDLTRETKQALAYAGIASALRRTSERHDAAAPESQLFGEAMHAIVDALVRIYGYRYEGVEPVSWEPMFVPEGGRAQPFHQLPAAVRHAVCFGVLPLRALWAAYPRQDPRMSEGVVAVDEFELHQEPAVAARVLQTLRACLPRVQWILTTSSLALCAAVDTADLLTLRRGSTAESIEVFFGRDAVTH